MPKLSIGLCCTVGLSKLVVVEVTSPHADWASRAKQKCNEWLVDEVFEGKDDSHGGQPEWDNKYQYQ